MVNFPGFEKSRYQQHDSIIREVVLDFNSNKAERCGCTPEQASTIPSLDDALVKAWLIQEAGGSDERSLAAWRVDPAQVNVPGDWNDEKTDLGLSEPKTRNEGEIKTNLKAAVAYLCRKGFGKSGKRPHPEATFDGWDKALERYNGRSKMCGNKKTYSQNYSDTIVKRSKSTKAVQIEIEGE
jgi:hypothetical protein